MSVSVAVALNLLSSIGEGRSRSSIVVVEGDHRAEALARIMGQLAPTCGARWFPSWDSFPYDRAPPSHDVMGLRMRVLRELGAVPGGRTILVTTAEALVQRVPARANVPEPLVVAVGETLDRDAFGVTCGRLGYDHADIVDTCGHVAIRGEAIDVFPAGPRPYRLSLDGDQIVAIHPYDPLSQRTKGAITSLTIDAVSEVTVDGDERFPGIEHWLPAFCPAMETLFDLLPDARVTLEPAAEPRLARCLEGVGEAYRDRKAADKGESAQVRSPTDPDRLYMPGAELHARLDPRRDPLPDEDDCCEGPRFFSADDPNSAFEAYVAAQRAAGRRVVLSATRERDLSKMSAVAEPLIGTPPKRVSAWDEVATLPSDAVAAIHLSADHGFDDDAGGVTLITAADLFGPASRVQAPHAIPTPWHLGDGEFAIGDAVIHLDHGMGVLEGLESVDEGAAAGQAAVRLRYAHGTDLLAPVSEMDRVWRYGAGDEGFTLDKLDAQAWQTRRLKIARELRATAQGLVDLARARERIEAPKIVPPRREAARFAAAFAYTPTADQANAVEATLKDMASGRPMDRLVVGDVGFGKTEVALRATAAAVLAGWQVAIVAPTTVLARQHVHTFTDRFAAFGIEVAQLSRLVSHHEAERVKAGLADGSIRLVVGTQALVRADVSFAKLGLLVIDEEQRFGTADKARLRDQAAAAHVLTLSATPIPRTLQSALIGLQTLSVIATPPARRRPIRTRVMPFDAPTIRAALLKEQARGGQSFVVIPRIEDLEPLAEKLAEMMPGFEIMIGHGRMDAHTVDETMAAFASGHGDILLATSIIESGLDVPRANTMVVCDADRFGLAQLHQLRGRVGRGRMQGLCYLTTAPGHELAPATERRLGTLTRLDRLGSGMAISAHDLDSRGAGDLMGDDQAGHMRLIGLGLYQHLLQQAILEAHGKDRNDWVPELNLGETGTFSPDYIPEPELRVNLYARLARATLADEIDALAEEVIDRFGPLPPSAARLFAAAHLRSACATAGVAKLALGPKAIALTPRPEVAAEDLQARLLLRASATAHVKDGRVIVAWTEGHESEQAIESVTRMVKSKGRGTDPRHSRSLKAVRSAAISVTEM